MKGEKKIKSDDVAELKKKLASVQDAHDKDGIALLRVMKERDSYKKAKEENDERFMGERDEARAEAARILEEKNQLSGQLTEALDFRDQARRKLDNAIILAEGDRKRFDVEKAALVTQAEELSAMIKQKISPAESCLEERQRGRGGCGCCAICCKELKDQLEAMTAKWNGAAAAAQKLGEEVVAASKVELSLKIYNGTLDEIHAERMRQDSKWGEQNHPDGTGGPNARHQADAAKAICNHHAKIGKLSWMHILTEEMLEVFAETEEEKLIAELIQSAAVATAWVEAIRRRQHGRPG